LFLEQSASALRPHFASDIMSNLSEIRAEIATIANDEASGPAVTRLANAIAELCNYVEEVERQSRNAFDEARRAKHDADRAMRGSR
jgi:outer membrane murein-binding lipoprotein Lpp